MEISNVGSVPKEKIEVEFTERSLQLKINQDIDGKYFKFSLSNFFAPIDTKKSTFVVRPKKIIFNLAKKEGKHWDSLQAKKDTEKVKFHSVLYSPHHLFF